MLRLKLRKMDPKHVIGSYTIRGEADRMPDRALFMHPDAARDYEKIESWVVVSDMFRSPEASLAAVQAKRGAQPPGYSMHNYGKAIDLDVGRTMRNLPGVSKKIDLDVLMEQAGFFCHRTDHLTGKSREHPSDESWHYNHLGVGARVVQSFKTTAGYAEALVKSEYGEQLAPDNFECQAMLKKLRMYGGEIDGALGPLSRQAIAAFQRTWGLMDSGRIDDRTRRTLAYVACEIVLS